MSNCGTQLTLIIDIGSGTQDVLFYETGKEIENCFKMVLPSPTQEKAKKIREITQKRAPLFLTGRVMGGGACVAAIKNHLKSGLEVFATKSAAKTINDNMDHVKALGIKLVEKPPKDMVPVELEDVNIDQWRRFCELWSIRLPDQYAVAVQDHGESMELSNRHFRMMRWRAFMDSGGRFEDLIYRQPPVDLTRMKSVRESLNQNVILMDTGAAAICGALEDPALAALKEKGLVIVNLGNSHTLIALVLGGKVTGLCEHHTSMLTPSKLSHLIDRIVTGSLTHQEVYDDGGHGVALAKKFSGMGLSPMTAVTGPKRSLSESLHFYKAVPHGDMMLSGCFGLLRAGRQIGFISHNLKG